MGLLPAVSCRREIINQLQERKIAWGKKRMDEVIEDMLKIIPANNGGWLGIQEDLKFLHKFRKEHDSKAKHDRI
jgi:hypothetical protein